MRTSMSTSDLNGLGISKSTSPNQFNNNNNYNTSNSSSNFATPPRKYLSSSHSFGSSLNLNGSTSSTSSSSLYNDTQQQQMNNNNNSALLSQIPQYLAKQYDAEVTQLFESNTPDQMKSIEFSKRSEIEDMKSQLRNLIGNQYRDLVEGSDAIVKMKKSTELISDTVVQMKNELKSFSEKRNTRSFSSIDQKLYKKKEMEQKILTISKHCKFLIDVPETIWRSLDSNEFFEASVQFLKAKYLYTKITTDPSPDVKLFLTKIPIIDKQWSTILQFPSKTISYANEFLKRQNITIEKIDINDDDEDEEDEEEGGQVKRKSPILSFTSSQLETTFNWNTPYLKESLKFYQKVSNGKSLNSSRWDKKDDDEQHQQQRNNNDSTDWEDTIIEFDNLSLKTIVQKTSDWLDQVISDFKAVSQEFLLGITTAKDLAQLHQELLLDFTHFSKPIQSSSPPIIPNHFTWNSISTIVSGKDMTRFIDAFEEILLIKAEQIIESSFSKINLSKILLQLTIKNEDKNFGEYLWSSHEDTIKSIRSKTSGFTPQTELFLELVDQLYTNCINDFVYLFQHHQQKNISLSPTTPTTPTNILTKRQQIQQKLLNQSIQQKYQVKETELKEFMKKSFSNSIKEFSSNNQSRIQQLYKSLQSPTTTNNPNIYFHQQQTTITSPTSTLSSPPISRFSTINSPPQTNNVQLKILDDLKQQFYLGTIIWIEDFVGNCTQILEQKLLSENWNKSRIKTWEKHNIIDSSNNEEEEAGSIKNELPFIYIPYQPSGFISNYLFSISLEVSRFSFNTLDKNIQRYLNQVITKNLYSVISNLLLKQSREFSSKEGLIQLLVDVKYISMILFGTTSSTTSNTIIKDQIFKDAQSYFQSINSSSNIDTSTESILVEQDVSTNKDQVQFQDIISLIENKIDPIDLALYTPHITKFLDNSYSKTYSLFGTFTQLHKSIPKSDLNQLKSDQSNTIPLVKCSSKFQLFPIENLSSLGFDTTTTTITSPTFTSTSTSSLNQNIFKKLPISPPSFISSSSPTTTATSPISSGSIPQSSTSSKTFSLMEQMGKRLTQNVLTNIDYTKQTFSNISASYTSGSNSNNNK
eukprot:gene4273-5346_t